MLQRRASTRNGLPVVDYNLCAIIYLRYYYLFFLLRQNVSEPQYINNTRNDDKSLKEYIKTKYLI